MISDEVWDTLRLRLNAEDRKTLETHQLYQRGHYLAARRKEADLCRAIDLYDQAIQRDRTHALAYAGKAEAFNLLAVYGYGRPEEVFPAAKAAAERALVLDNRLAEAHTTLAWVQFRWHWDFAAAGRELATALSLALEYAQARHWAAGSRPRWAGSTTGSPDCMRPRKSFRLGGVSCRRGAGPWSWRVATRRPCSLCSRRRLGAGQLHSAADSGHGVLGAWRLRPRDRRVSSALRLEGSNSMLLNSELAHVYAKAGRQAEARRQLSELLARRDRNTYVSPYGLALVYAGAADRGRRSTGSRPRFGSATTCCRG